MTTSTQLPKQISFLDAESLALNAAYADFFGEKQPIGITYTFITDRENGKEWSESEKSYVKIISQQTILALKKKHLAKMIMCNIVPDCAMARRFMATGSGQTESGYNF